MWRRGTVLVALAWPLLFGLVAGGQGYGNLDDDVEVFSGQQQDFFNQQASNLPQYDSPESWQPGQQEPQHQQSPQGNTAPSTSQQGKSSGQQNLWWHGQNAFQQPPGHPGVQSLAPNKNSPSPNQNAQGAGTGWQSSQQQQQQQQQPSQQYQNTPQYQTPQYNNPPPQAAQQRPQGGWNAPSSQQHQSQGQGQPGAQAGCDLVNKADCHNRRNFNVPALPTQDYEPPSLNPEPYPEQSPYGPSEQQQSIPDPNPSYRPPSEEQPSSYNPNPSYNPAPANPPPPVPQQPPYQPPPQPQRPPTQPSPLPQKPATQPRPQSYHPPQAPGARPAPQQNQGQPSPPVEEDPVPYPGCPAAMHCVQDEYCNSIGLIEENPIRLSAAEKLHRVALMQCSEPMTGRVGFCCRDPNYVDPWPDMNGKNMPNKNGGGHHPQNSKSPNFQPQHPPKGNHISGGGGGVSNHGWGRR